MKHSFAVLKMEATNRERGDIRIDGFRAAHKPQQNVPSYIVAQRNGHSQKFVQGHINLRKRKGTSETYQYHIDNIILPRWRNDIAGEMKPLAIRNWLYDLHDGDDYRW